MPARPTEPLREEHEHLLEHIEHMRLAARELPRQSAQERRVTLDRVLAFLRDTLLPHARLEEEVLYPEWARLVGHPDAAVPMVHDHEAIVARVHQLERSDAGDLDTLQELLYGLYALITVHFRKEEDIQLPLLDIQPPELLESLLARLEERSGHRHTHA